MLSFCIEGGRKQMVRIITDYLDATVHKFPEKIAFEDVKRKITFRTLQAEAYHIAAGLAEQHIFKQPVAVFLEKSVECIVAFMGTAYSGNFYTPMDIDMPRVRAEKIFEILQPAVILTDKKHRDILSKMTFGESVILVYEELMENAVDRQLIASRLKRITDTDVLYVMFTSGSTGTPKGVIISHRSVIDHAEWAANAFHMTENDIFANQAPFYFDHSILEIYQTLRNGATLYIVPKILFSFPKKLMSFLIEKRINTLIWVPSALCYLVNFKAVDKIHLPELRRIMFGGEVMPVKQLNVWRQAYPDVLFVNLYGPTEATDDSTYYIIQRELSENEAVPIGYPCVNADVFLLNENNQLITQPEVLGELCVRGSSLAYGYYRNPTKTKEAFVQNPLNPYYEEKIYRTGDLVRYNMHGELVYVCRKDLQIKHMGQRIELGEIETAVSAIEGVTANCCIYDDKNSQIVLFYTGDVDSKKISGRLKQVLPVYMLPNHKIHLDGMPLNLNGKLDRLKLKEGFLNVNKS